MKDARRLCTNSVNETGSQDNVMRCQIIFQFSAGITMKVIQDGLDSRQVTSLNQRIDVYQVLLLLAVSVDICNTVNTVGQLYEIS